MKKITIGILAHVDAGKTTLTEAMLYLSGTIRKHGRVDHGDAFLDFGWQERQRGITIFSKQANFHWKETEFVLLDTPGHVDFSLEMERTLSVLDYAVMVINGLDGVQSHTQTIWKLLEYYHIPTFVFVNKMDLTHYSHEELFQSLSHQLSNQCVDFTHQDDMLENIALCDEQLLDEYENTSCIQKSSIVSHIRQRHIFPCLFGSALQLEHVDELLDLLNTYTSSPQYLESFGAIAYKVSRYDKQRFVHLKITGGSLSVKDVIQEDKVNQIRVYSGMKYQHVQQVEAGDLCCVQGLDHIQAGDVLGNQLPVQSQMLSTFMNYRMIVPSHVDLTWFMNMLNQMSEENPELHITCHQKTISVQFMGEIQIEVLKSMIKERCDVDVDFDQGEIIYKETIANCVEGVGHFEPLRHYAEVHLLLEPGPKGSGLVFESRCSYDLLDRHYQRLIMSHLKEKEHRGVLTGSPITDMKITLVSGKAHLKHTEGGDFREATYRALRQGLKCAQSILLEPYYDFECHVPIEYMSRIMFDIENRQGVCQIESQDEKIVCLKGYAPVSLMHDYQKEVISLTSGQGRIIFSLRGYDVCQNYAAVIEHIAYDSESDVDNPTGSIFCSHGAGFYVPYDKVYDYMHIPLQQKERLSSKDTGYKSDLSGDEELKAIFEKTYGKTKRYLSKDFHTPVYATSMQQKVKPECLLVDGYNVIFSWDELKEIARSHLDVARERLIDILSNYQGYRQCLLIIVFDAYKVKQNQGTIDKYHNIYVVYTKEAQTADMYIERTTHHLAKDYQVIVATSDALEQVIVTGQGARRMSSRELELEVKYVTEGRYEEFIKQQKKGRHYLLEDVKKFQ